MWIMEQILLWGWESIYVVKWVFIEPGKLGQSHGWIFNSSCLDIYISKPVRKTTINFYVLLIDLKVADFRIMSTNTTSKWVEERKKRHMHLKLKILETLALSKPPQVTCAKVLIYLFSLVFPHPSPWTSYWILV
jgi:hypothetical protein